MVQTDTLFKYKYQHNNIEMSLEEIFLVQQFDTEYTEKMYKNVLRQEFTKYSKIKDIRVIDMLIVKVT